MNTASIGGRAAAIYGVGPTATPVRPPSVADAVSAFVLAVRSAFVPTTYVDHNTGGTYGVSGFYVVGGYADAVVIRATAAPHEAMASAVAFATVNAAAIRDGHGLGWWADANGRVWLDVVRTFDDYAAAIDAAVANGERAICRLSDGQAIDVATSGNRVR